MLILEKKKPNAGMRMRANLPDFYAQVSRGNNCGDVFAFNKLLRLLEN